MPKRDVSIAQIVYEIMKYEPKWVNRNHVIIYSPETVDLETGREREIIAEYPVNRAKLKKLVNERL